MGEASSGHLKEGDDTMPKKKTSDDAKTQGTSVTRRGFIKAGAAAGAVVGAGRQWGQGTLDRPAQVGQMPNRPVPLHLRQGIVPLGRFVPHLMHRPGHRYSFCRVRDRPV